MPSMRTVVAGVSHWHAKRHMEGFRAGGAEIVGVEDAEPAIAAAVAAEQGCRAYQSVEQMLDEGRPEFALVLGEPTRMLLAARAVVERRVPFMAEKPIALRSADVFAVADAVERAGLFAAVAFVNRGLSLWRVQREMAADGRMGNISHLATRGINGPPRRYADWNSGWMLDPARAGGGALHNLGIHGFDGFLHLTGADPDAVDVLGVTLSSRAHGEPIEDYGVALLRAPDGTVGTIEAGYTYPVLASGMTRGGDGLWRIASAAAYLVDADGTLTVTFPDGREETQPSRASYEAFCLDVLDRVRSGRPPAATVRDCARAVRLIERVYASARAGG